jgi:regulator of protease activity HflC (stomatin/prohibitin superfamily)
MFAELISVVSLIGCIIALIAVYKSHIIVQSGSQVIVERLGKFHTVLEPGFHILIPFIDKPRYVRWTYQEERRLPDGTTQVVDVAKEIYAIPTGEEMIDFDEIDVLSKDRLSIIVNCVAWFKVHNIYNAVYNISNLTQSLQTKLFTQIRDVLSRSTLEEAIEGRPLFQREVTEIINKEVGTEWGIKLTRFEIQNIDTSQDIRDARTKAVVQRTAAESKQLQIEVDRKTKIAEAETSYKLDEMELKRKRYAKDVEIATQNAENNAKLERERAIHDAELHKKLSKEKADLETYEAKRRAEIELEKQAKMEELDRLRIEGEIKHQQALENATAQAALIKGQMDAGLNNDYFMMSKYSENIRAMLTNAQKIIIPENIANHIAPAAMINNFKAMLNVG